MRASGEMEYITPRQIATESSTTPKSVMKTIVCGYFRAASAACMGTAASKRTGHDPRGNGQPCRCSRSRYLTPHQQCVHHPHLGLDLACDPGIAARAGRTSAATRTSQRFRIEKEPQF